MLLCYIFSTPHPPAISQNSAKQRGRREAIEGRT